MVFIMEGFLSVIETNMEVIVLAAAGVSLISFVMWITNSVKTGCLIRRYNNLMKGMDGGSLDEKLHSYLESVERVLKKTEDAEAAYRVVRKMAENSVQNVGVVRFNAFDDTGSDLSFALALLNHHGDGVVISSLFGRNETRIYAKPVNKGGSSYVLSDEEKQAIDKALVNLIR